jgi:hypothetical protein
MEEGVLQPDFDLQDMDGGKAPGPVKNQIGLAAGWFGDGHVWMGPGWMD